jgi:hypothetical protein
MSTLKNRLLVSFSMLDFLIVVEGGNMEKKG